MVWFLLVCYSVVYRFVVSWLVGCGAFVVGCFAAFGVLRGLFGFGGCCEVGVV